ncbi:hypothetical protein BH18CHL1_BH18CHL1_04370 [soil metagenome]
MHDDLETILRLVAAGELSPEEADPKIARATGASAGEHPREESPQADGIVEQRASAGGTDPRPRRAVRLQVTEHGRSVVDLRIPMNLASLAGSVVPGLATAHVERIRDAIRAGEVGPVLEIRDEDGDGVIISTE